MQERIFFQGEGVTVTNARLIVPGQTFAVRNITAVKWARVLPERAGAVLAILTGIVILLFALGHLIVADQIALSTIAPLVIAGLGCLAPGVWVWRRALVTAEVVLVTSAGEVKALGGSIEFTSLVAAALSQAVAER